MRGGGLGQAIAPADCRRAVRTRFDIVIRRVQRNEQYALHATSSTAAADLWRFGLAGFVGAVPRSGLSAIRNAGGHWAARAYWRGMEYASDRGRPDPRRHPGAFVW